jgi:hypothetical protein
MLPRQVVLLIALGAVSSPVTVPSPSRRLPVIEVAVARRQCRCVGDTRMRDVTHWATHDEFENIPSIPERGQSMRYVVISFCLFAAACAEAPSAPTSLSSPIGGAAITEAAGGSELPLGGTLEATETAGAVRHLVGTGEATQLGRFTLTSDFTVDTTTGIGSGTAIWTAANGDKIFTTLAGQAVITFPIATVTETHTITGGTGRFADASGSIVLVRSLNIPTLTSSGSITGTISLGH